MKFTILRPLAEDEPYLKETLESTFHLIGKNKYEIIFCATEPIDPKVLYIASNLCRAYPHIPAQIVTLPQNSLVNPKLSNLYKGWRVAEGEWILMVDCNVFMPPDTFYRLSSRWNSYTGLVCSPPIGARPDNFWAEVECAFLNTFQAKWQILVDKVGFGFAQGKVMMANKFQFEHFGGLPQLDLQPAEDAAATKIVRSYGYSVKLPKKLFEQWLGKRSFSQIWNRQLRWAKLRRKTFPFYYSLELFTTLIPSLIFLFLFPTMTLTLMILGYIGEITLARYMGWFLSWRSLYAMGMRDILMTLIWIMGWFGSSFEWGGHKLELGEKHHEPN